MTVEQYIKLFKSLPEAETEMLMIAMNNGMEIAVQRIMRYEDHYMLVRGRLGGTEEGELIFLVDYCNITFVYFLRPIADARVQEIFGEIIGGIRREFIEEKTPEEQEADRQAAAEAEGAAADKPEGAPKPLPNVSALRSRLLQNRSQSRHRH